MKRQRANCLSPCNVISFWASGRTWFFKIPLLSYSSFPKLNVTLSSRANSSQGYDCRREMKLIEVKTCYVQIEYFSAPSNSWDFLRKRFTDAITSIYLYTYLYIYISVYTYLSTYLSIYICTHQTNFFTTALAQNLAQWCPKYTLMRDLAQACFNLI